MTEHAGARVGPVTAAPEASGERERTVRVLHLSDLHCGKPFVAAHVAAAESLAASGRFDAIVMSGDLSQRARETEFRSARVILDRLEALAPVITVPGNHDSQWLHAPFGLGARERVHERWRALIQPDTEPTVRVPGVSLVGLNSAPGLMPWTLTWYPRDWRVKGGLTDAQIEDARQRLTKSASGDLRVLVVHHNVVRGRLSRRWGLARPHAMLDAMAGIGADVVCNGHDHEERVEVVRRSVGQVMISTANTLSSRARGHRPSALNVIEADASLLSVTPWTFDAARQAFVPATSTTMPRTPR